MAALTWREVSAPQMDTRNLAQAGQSIIGSFDRLGDMFIKREENARGEATDAEVAKLMSMGSPEQVSAYLARAGQAGAMDPRVNMRALMEAGRSYEAQRIQADMTNQTRLDVLDRVNNAGDVAKYYSEVGREGATQEEIAAARAGVLDSRNAADYVKSGIGIWDQTRGREMTATRDQNADFVARGNLNVANRNASTNAAQVGLAQQRLNMDKIIFDQGQADIAKRKELEGFGATQRKAAGSMARSFMSDGITAEDGWQRYTQMLSREAAKPNGKKMYGSDFTPEQLQEVRKEFGAAYGDQSYANPGNLNNQETKGKTWSLGHATDAINKVQTGITSDIQRNQRKDRLDNPGYWAVKDIEEGGDAFGKKSQQDIREMFNEKIGLLAGDPFTLSGDDVLRKYDPKVAEYVLTQMDFKRFGVNNIVKLKEQLDLVQDAYSNKNDTMTTGLSREASTYGPMKAQQKKLADIQRRANLATQVQGSMPVAIEEELRKALQKIEDRKKQ